MDDTDVASKMESSEPGARAPHVESRRANSAKRARPRNPHPVYPDFQLGCRVLRLAGGETEERVEFAERGTQLALAWNMMMTITAERIQVESGAGWRSSIHLRANLGMSAGGVGHFLLFLSSGTCYCATVGFQLGLRRMAWHGCLVSATPHCYRILPFHLNRRNSPAVMDKQSSIPVISNALYSTFERFV